MRRLRIAVVISDDHRAGGQYRRAQAEILSSPAASLCAVITWPVPGRTARSLQPWRLLLRGYQAMDRKVAGVTEPTSPAGSDQHNWGENIVRFDWPAIADRGSAAWKRLGELAPDVIVSWVHDESILQLASASRLGVWWRGPVPVPDPGLAECHLLNATASRQPVVDAIWARSAGSRDSVQVESASARVLSGISVELNKRALQTLAPALWERALRRALEHEGDGVPVSAASDAARNERSARAVGAISIGSTLARMAVRQVAHRRRLKGQYEEWQTGIRAAGSAAHTDAANYRWIDVPRGHWIADPFLVPWQDRHFLFVEDFDEERGLGSLVCAEVREDGRIDEWQPVLTKPYHLSYPFVFAHEGEMFMIPESGANSSVDLYQAVEFPARWQHVRTLLAGAAFDTTMLRHDGLFWFFTSLIEDHDCLTSKLMLYSSERLDGDWKLHPQSPLTMDSRYARNAGGILVQNGELLRPAQDCSEVYGGAVEFRRIEMLNALEYREVPAGRLDGAGKPDVVGIHTYSRAGNFESIDRRLVIAKQV